VFQVVSFLQAPHQHPIRISTFPHVSHMSGPFYCNRKQRETEKKVKSKGEVTMLYGRGGETASLC